MIFDRFLLPNRYRCLFTAAATFVAAAYGQTAPTVLAIASGVGGTSNTAVSPGSIITLTGTNFAAASINSALSSNALPTSLGGVQVTIGGVAAPLFMVSATMIEAEVPLEVSPGSAPVIVTSNSAASAAVNVTVNATSPTVLSDTAGAVILKISDYSRVGPGNPIRSGEMALIYATGLGATSPAQTTVLLPRLRSRTRQPSES